MDKVKPVRSMFIFLIVLGVVVIVFQSLQVFNINAKVTANLDYKGLTDQLDKGYVASIFISPTGQVTGRFRISVSGSYTLFQSQINPELVPALVARIEASQLKPDEIVFNPPDNGGYLGLIFWILPIMLIIWIVRMMSAGSGGKNPLNFGKSKAKLIRPENTHTTFNDIGGIDEAKEELKEIVEFLKDPRKFTSIGARIPKGVLLVGPPGTGKTLLAKAVAGEAKVPFFSISGSEFVEMFVGVGASRVRDLFEQGNNLAPCIIFIDELDALGRKRGLAIGGSHEEREQTLNQLLVEMDGFGTNSNGVIMLGATNRADVLDPALLRPGRFDRQVMVDRPDIQGRLQILKIHTKKLPLNADADLTKISRGTPGFSGADLSNLANEAALHTAHQDRTTITHEDLEFAKDKVLMGPERRSRLISKREKKIVAYHEAGHALITVLLPEEEADPLHKVTIISRGYSGGSTWQLPEEDKIVHDRKYLKHQLTILLGGRTAEEIALGEITTGASNDFGRATELAQRMVKEWGMSENIGPLNYIVDQDNPFSRNDYSEDTAQKIDAEVKGLVFEAHKLATQMITEHKALLDKIAAELIDKEVLSGDEVRKYKEDILREKGKPNTH